MNNIGERIKFLRKELKLSQTEFGERFGVGLGAIRNMETSKTVPSSAQLDLIARVYNVSREWLETGEGEMLADMSREEKIGRFVADILADEPESFRRRLLDILMELDVDGWAKLEEAAKLLSGAVG